MAPPSACVWPILDIHAAAFLADFPQQRFQLIFPAGPNSKYSCRGVGLVAVVVEQADPGQAHGRALGWPRLGTS